MTEIETSSSSGGFKALSPIQSFYSEKTIFITGGTGFLGKVLIEKLLRCCPNLKALYLLVRAKKGKSVEERLKDIFADVLFEEMKKEHPEYASKINVIPGDCSLPGLGISEENRKLLTKNVNIVFHVAATVRFEENLKTAMEINVLATQEVLSLCHSMENVDSIVYVSTAYSFCYLKDVGEKVYEQSPNFEKALKLAKELTSEQIELETPSVLGKWPNTYTLTKGMAENLVKKTEGYLPVCIFRPAIVTSTNCEPVPGWIDNLFGPTGIVIGAGTGVVRTVQCNMQVEANIVPVDLVINGILASAKETSKNYRNDEKEIKVYNFVSSTDNPIKYRDFMAVIQEYGVRIPSTRAIWYYSLTITQSRSLTILLCLILHLIPALLVDGISIFIGKKPQMTAIYNKVHKFIKTVAYFTTRQWVFDTDNVRSLWEKTNEIDKKLFNFDIQSINWDVYLKNYIKGARIYLLKDDMSTLPEALKKWKRLYWYHQIMKLIFIMLMVTVCWYCIRRAACFFA